MERSKKLMMVLALSSVPALAFSVSLRTAVGLGIYTFIALALTTMISYPLVKSVSKKASAVVSLLVSVMVVSLMMMVLEAFRNDIYRGNGVYFALTAVTPLLLSSLIETEGKNFRAVLSDALQRGSEWFLAVVLTAFIRELVGKGSLMGKEIAFLTPYRISILSKPFGGFVIYALMASAVAALDRKEEKK